MSRRFALPIVLALILLVAGPVLTGSLAHGAPAAPRSGVGTETVPAANQTVTTYISWNGSGSHGWVAAPANVTLWIHVTGPAGTYGYTLVDFALRNVTNGTLTVGASGAGGTNLTMSFVMPANYTLNLTVQNSVNSNEWGTWGGLLPVYGPAGMAPLTVTASQSSSFVTGNATYNLTVAGRPAGSTILWAINYPGQTNYGWFANQSSVSVTPLLAGLVYGSVQVTYPGGLVYASEQLASLSFSEADSLSLSYTNATAGSPTTSTLYANATPITGAPTITGSFVAWNYSLWTYRAPVTVTGSLAGSPITPTFWFNTTQPSTTWVEMIAHLYAPEPGGANGTPIVDLATSVVNLQISNTTGGPGPSTLVLWVINSSIQVTGGVMNFSLGAQVPNAANGSLFNLSLTTYQRPSGNTTAWLNNNSYEDEWNGRAAVTIPGSLPTGNYTVVGALVNANMAGAVLSTANVSLGPNSSGPSGGGCPPSCPPPPPPPPLTLSVAVSPSNGTSPLSVNATLTAIGGTAPYNLSTCFRGPSTTSSVTGSCVGPTSLIGWNGSALSLNATFNTSGYYAINASVTDANRSSTSASAVVQVYAAAGRPILQAQASLVPPSGGGGSYGFVTLVSGGFAPYDIQWTFGDGSSGSALPGETVTHTFTASGTYTATLTVTDAHGTVVRSSVGPFTVVLPTAPGTTTQNAGLTPFDSLVLAAAAVIVLASLVSLVAVSRWVASRREALNWLEDLERQRGPSRPPNAP